LVPYFAMVIFLSLNFFNVLIINGGKNQSKVRKEKYSNGLLFAQD
jgi:hypothetical protein